MSDNKRHIDLEANKHLKENPFEVENGYFKGLKGQILNAAKASESEIEFNLHLKQNKMEVPDHYFASLADNIEQRIREQEASKESDIKVVSLQKRNEYKWFGIAASFLLVAALYFGISTSSTPTDGLAAVSDDVLLEYLENETELSEDLITNIEDIDIILDEIYMDETGDLTAMIGEHPELEYDFEYYE